MSTTIPKVIEIGKGITIYEGTRGENEVSTVKLQIPYTSEFVNYREISEYKEIALDGLRTQASSIFGLIRFLGEELEEADDYGVMLISEWISFLGVIGSGLQEAHEITEGAFERYTEKPDKTAAGKEAKEPVLDLSGHTENLNIFDAEQLIGKHRNLPKEVKQALRACAKQMEVKK